MSALWAFALLYESIVFAMTLMRAIQHRRSNEVQTPILKSLYRDQFLYYTIIIFVRTFNLLIWNFLPPSLLFLGVFFIWALVTALVSRIMLNLRDVACSNMQTDQTFFGETAYSTRIVWARHNSTFDTSIRTITPEDERAVGPQKDAGAITSQSNEEGGSEGIELQDFRRRTHEVV
ncbi:hypothetical protein M407DRAFT_31191 [Tulasnella calospora MUT 4182]|uniref:Uncharacterized protein n=1 Tax=Tulasnella calospora MUT 4182 TaxID=1051891 RepID=A0A0C3LCF5_9AGAM|nr:hypothetical protein M407DRAFT_31191 [Tulasnella calospora MUT 4182]